MYLIRHTTPLIAKGICYGQTDLDVTESFEEEYQKIKPHLPASIQTIYSSPLQRCKKLAVALFPDKNIVTEDALMELNCGNWEMQLWDEIPKDEIRPWMDNFIEVRVPGGESYADLHDRVVNQFNKIKQQNETAVIVAHGGVLRSILAYITQTPLKESFDVFTFHYGCVIKITEMENQLTHEILYNVQINDKEWHRPSSY